MSEKSQTALPRKEGMPAPKPLPTEYHMVSFRQSSSILESVSCQKRIVLWKLNLESAAGDTPCKGIIAQETDLQDAVL